MIEGYWDELRIGTPVTFSAEQVLKLLRSRVLNPWLQDDQSVIGCQEIAAEAIKRGIVETISTRSVERFLKRSRFKASSKPLLAQC